MANNFYKRLLWTWSVDISEAMSPASCTAADLCLDNTGSTSRLRSGPWIPPANPFPLCSSGPKMAVEPQMVQLEGNLVEEEDQCG